MKIALHSILVVICCCTAQCLSAQTTDNYVLCEVIDKGDYYYIPKSALADSVHAVLYPSKTRRKAKTVSRPINFYWHSNCNDGSFDLTISPKQIFFSSKHDNPNPNFLFWVIEIDSTQFEQIRFGVHKRPPRGLVNISKYYDGSCTVFYDEKFKDTVFLTGNSDSAWQKFDGYCKIQIKRQLEKYFSIINSYIIDHRKKVSIPEWTLKLKYFSSSKLDFEDWLPVKFDAPNNK